MKTLLSPHYKLQEVTENDMVIASLAWGFTLGFGWLTTWTAIKQTVHMYKRQGTRILRNLYLWMIWLEIIVCTIFSIICWLHLRGVIPPCFLFYFSILTLWALQVHFLLQIIINRCAILLSNQKVAWRVKVGVATLITAINISVYNIWIPARLQISPRYIAINGWWDRCEKVIYLIVDGSLNIYFVRIVQKNLVMHGLTKYKLLTRFNMFIIGFSLSMDLLMITMMSLKNTFVYVQFHPLAYMVKLKIEMSMAELIGKVARKRDVGILSAAYFNQTQGRNSYQPSEYNQQVPSYARGRPDVAGGGGGGNGVGAGIDVALARNISSIELEDVATPRMLGMDATNPNSGPTSWRPSSFDASAVTASEAVNGKQQKQQQHQPKMTIYRTTEVFVEVEQLPAGTARGSHEVKTSPSDYGQDNAADEVFCKKVDLGEFDDGEDDDDHGVTGGGERDVSPTTRGSRKFTALPDLQAPWAGTYSTRIWDGTNYEQDLTVPVSVAKIGSGWQDDGQN